MVKKERQKIIEKKRESEKQLKNDFIFYLTRFAFKMTLFIFWIFVILFQCFRKFETI
mgnify:CR=1 FL=1